MTWRAPLILIGMDAATWEVMDPLLASGRLPNLAQLIQHGASGKLRSLVQYPSPALWTSILTGKRPENHGVIDFYSATRSHLRSATLHEILDEGEGRVGLFRWFATWPPEPNAGFTVPSAIARSPDTHPPSLHFLNELVHPTGWRSYLQGGLLLLQRGGRLSTLVRAVAEAAYELLVRPAPLDTWYRRRLVEAAIYGDVFAYLLRAHQPTSAAILLFHTDDLSHRYWKYRQPDRFEDVGSGEVRRYGEVIDKGYIASDRAIGQILRTVPEDSLVVVVSDHGQQAGPDTLAPYRMSADLLRILGVEEQVWMTYIGYGSSLRPRTADGGPKTVEELQQALEQIRLQPDGEPVFSVAREEGLQLTVQVRVDPRANLNLEAALPGNRRVRLGEILFCDGRISGIHSQWGVLIVKGPGVRAGQVIEEASILDVTPTLLALRGRPVGRDMEGRVLVEALEPGFLDGHPVRYVDSHDTARPKGEEVPFTDGELKDLEARLRSLGYLA